MWDKSPTLFADAVEKVAVNHVKKLGREIVGSLADQSPVDTSEFTSNNNISMDAPNWSHSPTKLLGVRGSEATNMAFVASMPPNKLRDLWFTNATPYGGELEYESKSRQASNGVYLPVFLFTAQMFK